MGGSLVRRFAIHAVFSLVLGVVGLLALVSSSAAYAAPMQVEEITTAVNDVKTVTLARRAEHVAVYWEGNKNARVTLAFSSNGTSFGVSVDAGRDDAGNELRDGMTYGEVRAAEGAVAVRITTDVPLGHFHVVGMSFEDCAESRLARAGLPAGISASGPTVISRSGWSADPAYLNWAPQFYPAKKLILHHTANNIKANETQGYYAKLVRSIYYYHAVTQDWGDIAYNFLIDPLGNIYEGRYSDNDKNSPSGEDVYGNGVIGGHTRGYNTGTVGIAVLGTYSSEDISAAARSSLEQLVAWVAAKNGIDPTGSDPYYNPFSSSSTMQTFNIAGHRDYGSTDCPGASFYNALPGIREEVLGLTGPVTTPTPILTYIELSTSQSSPSLGEMVTITAKVLAESSREPLPGRTVSFSVGGIATASTSLGTAITDSRGVASLQTAMADVGMRWVTAVFAPGVDGAYRGSTTSTEVNVRPTGLNAIPGNSSVRLSWPAARGASGYNVYRDGVKLNSAPIVTTSYLDTGLKNGVTYVYQLSAAVNGRESAKSIGVYATPAGTTPETSVFSDISSSPYQSSILTMAGLSIISGYNDGTFRPDNLVMRKQFAKMIVGAMGLQVSEDDWQDADRPYTDCGRDDPASTYPHDFIAVAKLYGLTQGKTATTFDPDASITRAQIATMVVRAAKNSGINLRPLGADYSGIFLSYNNVTHAGNVKLAEYNGLLQGLVTDGVASSWLDAYATRGEVAQILNNLMQNNGR